jgi:hypothetical protein
MRIRVKLSSSETEEKGEEENKRDRGSGSLRMQQTKSVTNKKVTRNVTWLNHVKIVVT